MDVSGERMDFSAGVGGFFAFGKKMKPPGFASYRAAVLHISDASCAEGTLHSSLRLAMKHCLRQ